MSESDNNPEIRIALFQKREIRRTIHNNEWWFVIADVIGALTDSIDPQGYIKDMRRRDPELSKGWGQIATPLSVKTSGGKQKLNCANTEGIFRIIQSIPSPRVEPLKRWLARVGKERIDEIENPELAMVRMQELYEKKGYPKEWIDKRMRGIAVRQDLTDEWKNRGARNSLEYGVVQTFVSQDSNH
ncbi:MAG: Bro-N domain-containing protein [Desulfobacterales bacterium]|nr:Bro-N domain-containing protein [Desulfobacterales bacterium]